jgi:hypothetical protein
MKRSADVTAAAVVMFCGSGLLLFLGAFAIFGAIAGSAGTAGPQRQVELAGAVMIVVIYGGLAAWGIATGVGIVKLQAWARISAIVMSVLAIAGCVMAAASVFMMQSVFKTDNQLPPHFARMMLAIVSVMFAIPAGIAIWWVILFMRKRVALEFATPGGEAAADGATQIGIAGHGGVYGGTANEFADGSITTSFGGAPSVAPFARGAGRPPIPISIRIVAVFYIIGSAMLFLTLEYMHQTNMPTLLLGKLVGGWRAWTFLGVLGVAQLAICIAVLKRRAWALDGLMAIMVFGIVNSLGFVFSPSRDQLFARTLASENLPPGVEAQTMDRFMHMILPFSLIVGTIIGFVLLYFLLTRRRVFREACAAREQV